MQPFPVTSSILSADALAPYVRDAYALTGTVTCRLLCAGINHTYLVSTGQEQYVFRIYSLDWRTRLQIHEELDLLLRLRAEGVSVSYPIAGASGVLVQELPAPEGMRYAVLFSFAPGQKLLSMDEAAHHRIGALMASLHQLTAGLRMEERTTYTTDELLDRSLRKIARFLPEETEEMRFMRACARFLKETMNASAQADLPHGIVHLDIWFDNLNIDTDGKITLFDFDFSGNGWLCLDVAYYLMQLHFLEPVAALHDAKRRAFLKGYQSVRLLAQQEQHLLPYLGTAIYFFYLGIQCERFENWSNVFVSETYVKRYIQARIRRYFDFALPGNGL